MPSVEIDEVELLRLRKQDKTVHTMLGNEKAKRKIFEAYREVDPNVRVPELEAIEAAEKPLLEMRDQVAKLQKQIEDDAAERQKQAKLNSLTGSVEQGKTKLRQSGWTDEGIAAVEKVMEDKGILDVDVAAAYYEKQHPPAMPATPRGQGAWGFVDGVADDEKDLKAMVESKGGNEMLADKMARDVLNDIRGATRR